jgi:hypothetical protein
MDNAASSTKDLEQRKDDAAIITTEAKGAIEHEYDLTFLQAMRLYPKAAGWSIFFSLGIIMTAFDPQLLGKTSMRHQPSSEILATCTRAHTSSLLPCRLGSAWLLQLDKSLVLSLLDIRWSGMDEN